MHSIGNRLQRRMALAASVVVTLAVPRAKAATTFYIDEVTDYTGNGCENDNLNSVTVSLKSDMLNAGWSGPRYVNPDCWPQDFRESCSSSAYGPGGIDSLYPDTKSLAIYAGHGGVGFLQYGYVHDGICNHDFGDNMRLGSMSGAVAAHAMWLSCDALKISSLANEANWSWVWQQFGWRNTISIGNDEAANFFHFTDQYLVAGHYAPAMTNADAWLAVMDGDGRMPIVVSYGSNSSGCWAVHDAHKLKANVGNTPRTNVMPGPLCGQGQPAFTYCYEYA